MELLAQTNGK